MSADNLLMIGLGALIAISLIAFIISMQYKGEQRSYPPEHDFSDTFGGPVDWDQH